MKYTVKKDCEWKAFKARNGQELTAADLVSDGKPLPQDVIDTLVRMGCLVAVEE